jgi:L-serine/L-threonine ammonia-lyase
MTLHVATPLLESDAYGAPGRRVWLKMEALQPSGSFKLRGIGHACEVLAARGARRLLSSSGGNAGLAVAYAGRRLGLPVEIVVPETTLDRPKALIRQQGAEVVVKGRSWMEANEHLASLRQPDDAVLHPFDDPLLWDGHASLIEEVAAQGPKPDVVVLAVGGGGLMCGVLQGLHACGWSDVPVVAAETEGAASLAAALTAGRPVLLPAITSIATSLGARQVSDRAFRWTREHPVHSVVVSDAEAVRACLDFADDHRVVVEPACGAALAVAVQRRVPVLRDATNMLVIVCGGVCATYAQLESWARRAAHP